jgi:hypothetical protein
MEFLNANGKRRGANINKWASQETDTFVGDVLLSQYDDPDGHWDL